MNFNKIFSHSFRIPFTKHYYFRTWCAIAMILVMLMDVKQIPFLLIVAFVVTFCRICFDNRDN